MPQTTRNRSTMQLRPLASAGLNNGNSTALLSSPRSDNSACNSVCSAPQSPSRFAHTDRGGMKPRTKRIASQTHIMSPSQFVSVNLGKCEEFGIANYKMMKPHLPDSKITGFSSDLNNKNRNTRDYMREIERLAQGKVNASLYKPDD